MSTSINFESHNIEAVKATQPNNQILQIDFPAFENYKELAVFKFNRFLTCLLLTGIVLSMASYSVVINKESVIATVHKQTNDMNTENVELQTKVDYLKSFYNINKQVSKLSSLKKADKVIELSTIKPKMNDKKNARLDLAPMQGF